MTSSNRHHSRNHYRHTISWNPIACFKGSNGSLEYTYTCFVIDILTFENTIEIIMEFAFCVFFMHKNSVFIFVFIKIQNKTILVKEYLSKGFFIGVRDI